MKDRPEYQFPAEIDELNFVMRWAGRGNRFIGTWDTMLHQADPDTRFLNGWQVAQRNLDELRLSGEPLASRSLIELNPFMTVEISVADWEKPRLARQFTAGVLFNRAQRRGRPAHTNLVRDVYEAFDPKSVKRFAVLKEAHISPFTPP